MGLSYYIKIYIGVCLFNLLGVICSANQHLERWLGAFMLFDQRHLG